MSLHYAVRGLEPSLRFHEGVSVSTTILLLCAVLASLAFGVLMAHWLCAAMFRLFRIHARQVQAKRALVAPVSIVQS